MLLNKKSLLINGIRQVSTLLSTGVLSFSIVCAPLSIAQANRTIASVREPSPEVRKTKALPAPLDSRQQAILHRALLDYIVSRYQADRNFADFDRDTLSRLKTKDHVELAQVFKDFKSWPTAHRVDDAIIFELSGTKVKVEIPDPERLVMSFDGMTWTFNSHQSLSYQIRLALRNLEYQRKNRSSVLFQLLLPNAEAQAIGPIATIIFSTVASVVVTLAMPVGCLMSYKKVLLGRDFAEEWGFCGPWRVQYEAAAARKVAPVKVDAMEKGTVADEERKMLKWLPDTNKTCQTLNDKTKDAYVVDFIELKRGPDDKWEKDGDWFSVVQKYHPDGKPDQFFITAKGTDTSDKNWQEKAVNTLAFKDGQLATISYINPTYNALDPASPRMLTQDVLATDASKALTADQVAEQAARRAQMDGIISVINSWSKICTDEKLVQDLQNENVPTVKQNPSPQVDASSLPSADPPPASVPNAAIPGAVVH